MQAYLLHVSYETYMNYGPNNKCEGPLLVYAASYEEAVALVDDEYDVVNWVRSLTLGEGSVWD